MNLSRFAEATQLGGPLERTQKVIDILDSRFGPETDKKTRILKGEWAGVSDVSIWNWYSCVKKGDTLLAVHPLRAYFLTIKDKNDE